ncbi:Rnf-Nqr domain containing protein [Tahibacter caeni]|uniref:Rnf-Nqr domain containing protein n=1 Tax=Tahibacter caeni TaxID=1453545 RepID=UPI002147F6FC|nr:Rnf-Nqr domain containing protein [Tahibacter caeni]
MDGGALIASLVALALANRVLLETATKPMALSPLGNSAAPDPTASPHAAATAQTPSLFVSTNATPTLRDLAVHGVLSALVVCLTAIASWIVQQALAPLALLHSTAFLALPLAAAAAALTAFVTTRWRAPLRDAAWPLIAANAVAIAVLVPAAATPDLATALLRSFLAGAGFTLDLLALAALDARLQPREAPAAFHGLPLSLLNAGLLTLAAQGLAGFVG